MEAVSAGSAPASRPKQQALLMLSGFENPLHLLMLFAVVFLLFGAKRLPEVGRSLGTGLREFKSSITGESAQPVDEVTPKQISEPGA